MTDQRTMADARDIKRPRIGHRFRITSPDKHQFVNTWFSVTVYVVNEDGQLKSGGGDKQFEIFLGVADDGGTTDYSPELIEVDQRAPLIILNGQGRAEVQVKILKCSMNDLSRQFFIEVRGVDNDIASTRTGHIIVIKHELQLSNSTTWENEWYKDEGGREKCFSFAVELKNSANVIVNRNIPLKITLLYGNGQEVARQDILKLMDSDRVMHNGRAVIRARIEEVSRNHQHQAFQIRVGPDVEVNPLDNDVSSVLSQSVEVRSKRNNRKKTAMPPTPTSKHKNKPDVHSDDGRDEAAAALVSVRYVDNQKYHELPVVPRQDSACSNQQADSSSREALTQVLAWIGSVLETAETLKWKEDFDTLPDGSLDTTPNFTMRNPNRDIDNLLQSYKSNVMTNLNTLIEEIESHDADGDTSNDDSEKSDNTSRKKYLD